jgi:SPP1 family predicted phage head-tail adaptor
MRAGKLNKKISILNPVEVQSTVSGELTVTWSTYLKNRWASVSPLSGRELYIAQQYKAELDTTFTIRYSEGITPEMRIVYNESSYHIHSVIDPEEEHKELNILASKVTT